MQATREEKRLWAKYWVDPTDELRNEIANRNLKILEQNAKFWVNKLYYQFDIGDLRSIGYFRLLKAVASYKLKFKTTFKTHATNCIRREYWRRALMEATRQRRFSPTDPASPKLDASYTTLLPDDRIDILRSSLERCLSRSDERTNDIFRLRFSEGLTLRAIGSKHGISKARVDQILARLIKQVCKDCLLTRQGSKLHEM